VTAFSRVSLPQSVASRYGVSHIFRGRRLREGGECQQGGVANHHSLGDSDPEFPDFVPSVVKALNFMVVKLFTGLFVVFIIASVAAIYFFNSPQIDTADLVSWKNISLLICILVPVVYVSVRMSFIVCFIVDQDSGVVEAIRQSWAITKGHFGFLLLLFIVIVGINMLGAMVLFIGLLFTVPFSSLITIVAYRQMVNSYVEEEDVLLEDVSTN